MDQAHPSVSTPQSAYFPPDPTGPERVAREVLTTVTAFPFVRAAALFGSLAEGRADCWSDVDLWVACDDVEHTQWVLAAAIRAAHPVLLYRMFSNALQPAGRYWFVRESPFHKLDISFHACAEYHRLISQPALLEYPITFQEVYTRMETAVPVILPAPFQSVEISEYERAIGSCIYLLLRAVKLYRRGEWERAIVEERFHTLLATLGETGRAAIMGGGAIGELAHRVIEVVMASLDAA